MNHPKRSSLVNRDALFKRELERHRLCRSFDGTEPPYRIITEDQAREDFEALQKLDSLSLLKKCGNAYAQHQDFKFFRVSRSIYVIEQDRTGRLASDFFHQRARWATDAAKSPGAERSWREPSLRRTLLNAATEQELDRLAPSDLRQMLRRRKYIASQFPPSAAKAIMELTGARRVLDPCAGWGDRLAAFHASSRTERYYGIDPNPLLHDGYRRQNELYATGKEVEIVRACAEDHRIPFSESFDLIFTSPPYFNVEKYTDDRRTQSWARYPRIEEWVRGFLHPTFRRAWDYLVPGGWLAVNIADVLSRGKVLHLCDALNFEIAKFPNAVFQGVIGMPISKMPGSRTRSDGTLVEYIWIWRKGPVQTTDSLGDHFRAVLRE